MDFVTAQTTLRELLDVDSTRYADAPCKLHLNNAVDELEMQLRPAFLHGRCTFTISASTPSYDGAVITAAQTLRFATPRGISFIKAEDGEQANLDYKDWDVCEATYPSLTTDPATPELVTIGPNGHIWLFPTPDVEIADAVLDYWGYTEDLVDNDDTNEWLNRLPMLVIYNAAEEACYFLLEDDRAPTFAARAQRSAMIYGIELSQYHHSAARPEAEEP